MVTVALLGSGDVGKTLAKGFLKYGYQVVVGTDHAEKLADFKNENPGVRIDSFKQAANSAEVVVLCIKGTAAESVIGKVKAEISKKIIIDATNPIADAPPENGVLKFFTSLDESLMERLQKIAPDARFVKALNSVGSAVMIDPDFGGNRPTMFICGNDGEAKKQVSQIMVQFGFEVEDMGMAQSARAIEPLCILWCIPGFLRNEWTHAFKLLKK
jgi:predicted dinucleotide-binding enzyme